MAMGGNAVYTFTAAELRGQGYTPEHAAAVEARGGYIGRPPAAPKTITRVRPGQATIRAWARANGIKVPPRGSVSADVVARFESASGQGTVSEP